jgi:hypothetical protein
MLIGAVAMTQYWAFAGSEIGPYVACLSLILLGLALTLAARRQS